jgi:LAO/AO transport system kinase
MPDQTAQPLDADDLARKMIGGDRAALGRAITLIESKRADHQIDARKLIAAALPHAGRARRIGVTGVPGVGKSTFIEAFGAMLTGAGRKVAVLAVDPSSNRTGGSILGDKTRMAQLAADPRAFIRPSPSAGALGGVTRKTRESMIAVEAAGYDVVLVETVGVGQSEVDVADMVDVFLVLMLPNAGDELQGIKKGVLEIADVIAINKSDVDAKAAARAQAAYQNALHILEPADPAWPTPVVCVSGLSGQGLPELWQTLERHREIQARGGGFARRRAAQQVRWMQAMIAEGLSAAFRAHPAVAARQAALEAEVAAGRMAASAAAEDLLALFRGDGA